jgi:hypothetical protein
MLGASHFQDSVGFNLRGSLLAVAALLLEEAAE